MRLGDSIIKTILTTDYTKRKLNKLVLFFTTLFVRSSVNAIVAALLYYDNVYIDFIIQTFLSIFIVLKTDAIYKAVRKYENEIFQMSCYFIDNYSEKNFRRWKKNVILTSCLFFIVYLYIVPITSNSLMVSTLQFLICYFVADEVEHRNGLIIDTYNKIMDRHRVKVYQKGDIMIIDNYEMHEIPDCEIREDFMILS